MLAKSPVAGRVKTRLQPTFSGAEAAALAAAAIRDTLDAVAELGPRRTVVAWDGPRVPWLPASVCVLPQRGTTLDERLEHVFEDVYASEGTPARVLLVGMDTPQLPPPTSTCRGATTTRYSDRRATAGTGRSASADMCRAPSAGVPDVDRADRRRPARPPRTPRPAGGTPAHDARRRRPRGRRRGRGRAPATRFGRLHRRLVGPPARRRRCSTRRCRVSRWRSGWRTARSTWPGSWARDCWTPLSGDD